MDRSAFALLALLSVLGAPTFGQARNVILFVGDGIELGCKFIRQALEKNSILDASLSQRRLRDDSIASAKTMAFDPKTRRIYLSSGDIEVVPAASASERPQRNIVANSFKVLVVAPK